MRRDRYESHGAVSTEKQADGLARAVAPRGARRAGHWWAGRPGGCAGPRGQQDAVWGLGGDALGLPGREEALVWLGTVALGTNGLPLNLEPQNECRLGNGSRPRSLGRVSVPGQGCGTGSLLRGASLPDPPGASWQLPASQRMSSVMTQEDGTRTAGDELASIGYKRAREPAAPRLYAEARAHCGAREPGTRPGGGERGGAGKGGCEVLPAAPGLEPGRGRGTCGREVRGAD